MKEEKPYRMSPRHLESKLQQACLSWFRIQFPRLRLNLFAVPNGGSRRRVEAAIMKAEGVTAGVSDLILLCPNGQFHGLLIEMKTTEKGSVQRGSQKAWEAAVSAHGYKYVVVRTFDEFRAVICDYLGSESQLY